MFDRCEMVGKANNQSSRIDSVHRLNNELTFISGSRYRLESKIYMF